MVHVGLDPSGAARIRPALCDLESEKCKLGESHTTDHFSLELELDCLKRDLARCEDELARARDDLREKEQVRHDRDGAIDKLVSFVSRPFVYGVFAVVHVIRSQVSNTGY